MSARAHHISFREFAGPLAARHRTAKTRKPSPFGTWMRRLFESVTTDTPRTNLATAYALGYATRPVPHRAG